MTPKNSGFAETLHMGYLYGLPRSVSHCDDSDLKKEFGMTIILALGDFITQTSRL